MYDVLQRVKPNAQYRGAWQYVLRAALRTVRSRSEVKITNQ
jgi:hypothetical protein